METIILLDTAKLAKTKGFNLPVKARFAYATWHDNQIHLFENGLGTCDNSNEDDISAPTHSVMLKWLREVHNLHIELIWDIFYQVHWYCYITKIGDLEFKLDLYDEENLTLTPEEALEKGIINALNLIA